jgi:DNA-binding SARP family transcriptional activator
VADEARFAEFAILGPLELRRSGRPVPLGGPRQRAVLALLLLEANRVVSMDRLAEDVWAGHPPEGWATTVQTYVFHLRHALEPDRAPGAAGDVLVTRDRGYLLRVDREDVPGHLSYRRSLLSLQANARGNAPLVPSSAARPRRRNKPVHLPGRRGRASGVLSEP